MRQTIRRFGALSALLMLTASASADVIGTVSASQGARIDLHDQAGICVGDARQAEYVSDRGQRINGCWTAQDSMVFVVFLDGDIARIPLQAIKSPTRS